MSARAIEVFPAMTVGSVDDKAAVLLRTGAAALGMSIAEARATAQRLARAADEAEYQLALRDRLRHEHDDQPRVRTFERQMEHESGKPASGPL